jgi:hypothetical protein
MKTCLFLALAFISTSSFAEDEFLDISAHRNLRTDYSVYEAKAQSQSEADQEKLLKVTPLNSAKYYSEATLKKPVAWRSMEDLQERFEYLRDERFLTTPDEPDFPRRISWLYPKDGCFARAALFNRNAFRMYIPIPNKIFVFGNLRVKTPNASGGVVGWWFHVAPIVRVGDTKYVMDPAIEATKPLPLHEWLARMGKPGKIKVAICGSGAYSPSDSCEEKTDGLEFAAERTIKQYLKLEKEELRRLGRNHELELGEHPPWKKQ